MPNRKSNIVKFKKKPRAAIIIFTIIFLYLVFFTIIYISRQKLNTYEVYAGSLTSNSTYTGLALREELVFFSAYSGNVNYYIREGSKAKVEDTIYTVDETGRVEELLSQLNRDNNSLSGEHLKIIKSTLNQFKTSYSGDSFKAVYDLKADLNATILQSVNETITEYLDSMITMTESRNLFQTVKTDKSGIVLYSIDEYETVAENQLAAALFDKTNYSKTNLKSETLIVENNPAYKLLPNEAWNIYISITHEDIAKYNLNSKKSVQIRFKKDNLTTSADISIINNNGEYYAKLSLNNYMIRYASERFLDIELITAEISGLKIPCDSLIEKDFYVIPKGYLTTGGNSNDSGFLCEYYNEEHELVTEFKSIDIYSIKDDLCYVSKNSVNAGSNILMPDSLERYVINQTASLQGVYCVNTGYTIFRCVEIVDRNNEYCIVKKGTPYGISTYDHILLDSMNTEENMMIY